MTPAEPTRAATTWPSEDRDWFAGTPWHKHVPARVEAVIGAAVPLPESAAAVRA